MRLTFHFSFSMQYLFSLFVCLLSSLSFISISILLSEVPSTQFKDSEELVTVSVFLRFTQRCCCCCCCWFYFYLALFHCRSSIVPFKFTTVVSCRALVFAEHFTFLNWCFDPSFYLFYRIWFVCMAFSSVPFRKYFAFHFQDLGIKKREVIIPCNCFKHIVFVAFMAVSFVRAEEIKSPKKRLLSLRHS